MTSFLRGSIEGSLNMPRLQLVDADSIVRLTKRIVHEAAEEGYSVIVGLGAAFFPANRPDKFHVFLHATYEDKVRRLSRSGMTPDEAARSIDTVDVERAEFIKRYFSVEWPSRGLYHLMINSRAGEEAVVRTVLNG
jgi:cytidylate kinase